MRVVKHSENTMSVTILPINEKLKEIVRTHGASGWVVLRNDQKDGKSNSLVCKDNKMVYVTNEEIR